MIRGGRNVGLGAMLLGFQVLRFGVDRIPPVTLVTLATNVLIFFRLIDHHFLRQPLGNVCISALHVWNGGDYSRLFLSSFFHANDWHLYFNMTSFLWKGSSLERRIGSIPFLYMIAVFSIVTNIVYVALALVAQEIFGDASYVMECAVGFSGVLFALKVVTTHYLPSGVSYVLGIFPVPLKYAVWAELVLIHLLAPGTSFIGHLAGIIVGTLYVKGPLQDVMDIFISTSPQGYGNRRRQTYTYTSGYSGYRSAPSTHHEPAVPNTNHGHPSSTDYYDQYTAGMSEEEQLAEAMRQSHTPSDNRPAPSAPPPPNYESIYPDIPAAGPTPTYNHAHGDDIEEMRRRRLRRFQ